MPSTHPIFGTIPPWEVVVSFCNSIGVGTTFPCEFHVDLLDISEYTTQLTKLTPYYHSYKASLFLLKDTNEPSKQIVKILRQLLRVHDYEIIAHETTRHNKKVTFYKILKDLDKKLEQTEYAVTFD